MVAIYNKEYTNLCAVEIDIMFVINGSNLIWIDYYTWKTCHIGWFEKGAIELLTSAV